MSRGRRCSVYVDGFNLYYGMARPLNCKWVDLQRLFETLRPNDDIQSVFLFTARTSGPRGDRHDTYMRALSTCSKVRVVEGQYKNKQVKCRVEGCPYQGNRIFTVPEEKETDVAIAVQMVADALKGDLDIQILVSGDGDLVPALRTVQEHTDVQIVVYVPAVRGLGGSQRAGATLIRSIASKVKLLPWDVLVRSQFDHTFYDGDRVHTMPPTWRIASNVDIKTEMETAALLRATD